MDAKQTGVIDLENPKKEEIDMFWQTYYPSLLDQDCKRILKFLRGKHLAPVPFYEEYTTVLLKGLGQWINQGTGAVVK